MEEVISLINNKKFNEALQKLKNFDQDKKNNIEYIHILTVVLLELKNFNEAEKNLKRLRNLNSNNPEWDLLEGNIFFHQKKISLAIEKYLLVIVKNPRNIMANLNLSVCYKEQKKYSLCIKYLKKIIKINPKLYISYFHIGLILLENNFYNLSIKFFNLAIKFNKDDLEIYTNKAIALKKKFDYIEALKIYNLVLKNNNFDQQALLNRGILFHEMKMFDKAIFDFKNLISLNPKNKEVYFALANTQLMTRDYKNGLANYEKRWLRKDSDQYRYKNIKRIQSIKQLNDCNILIWSEQGYGDTIQYSRFIRVLKKFNCKIFFEVQKDLRDYFSKQFECNVSDNFKFCEKFCDYEIPLLSIPYLLDIETNNIPLSNKYLSVNVNDVSIFKDKLNIQKNNLNIGLALSGNPKYQSNSQRSIKLEKIYEKIKLYNCYMIQKDFIKSDLDFMRTNNIKNTSNLINNFEDTANIIQSMDLIICVDTSIAHLAGALGKKTILLLHHNPEPRWLCSGNKSIWYDSIYILRQQKILEWGFPLSQLNKIIDSLTSKEKN